MLLKMIAFDAVPAAELHAPSCARAKLYPSPMRRLAAAKVEPAFMLGLRSPDAALRAASSTSSTSPVGARRRRGCAHRRDAGLGADGGTLWLRQAAQLLLAIADAGAPLAQPPGVRLPRCRS